MRLTALLPATVLLAAFALFGLAAQRPHEQAASPASTSAPALTVRGIDVRETKFSVADFASLPRRTITVHDKDDAEVKYEGVAVQDVLTEAGMKFGQSIRGPRLRDFLLAESGGSYAVVFALPEISDEFARSTVLIADRINGQPLPERDGPFRIIAPQDKKHARWIRNVTSLTILSSADPPGK